MKIAAVVSDTEGKFGPILYRGKLQESIEKLANLGYDGVEIFLAEPRQVDRAKLLNILKTNHVCLTAIGTGQAAVKESLTLTDSKQKVRETAVKRIMEQIDFAAEFSASIIIGLIRGNLPQSPKKDEAIEWAIDACEKCADYARKKGTDILIEMINRYELNWLNKISEGLEFLHKAKRNNILLHIDTFHMNIEEVSFKDSILQAKNSIGYVHLADSNRWAPGYGHTDFEEIVSALEKIDYQGFLSLEVLPMPDADAAAKKGIETIQRLLGRKHLGR